MDPSLIPGRVAGSRHPDWHRVYEGTQEADLPWHFGSLDPDFQMVLERPDVERGRLLDVGCGLGSQTQWLSRLGYRVTAIDISRAAIARAIGSYPGPDFVVDDFRNTKLSTTFDVILDRGCFHVLDPIDHTAYLRSVLKLLSPRGLYLLKILNIEQGDADFGPVRFSQLQIHSIFGKALQIIKMHRSVYYGTSTKPPSAWFCVMRGKNS